MKDLSEWLFGKKCRSQLDKEMFEVKAVAIMEYRSPRHAKALCLRFGFMNGEHWTHRKIGVVLERCTHGKKKTSEFGVTTERVVQIMKYNKDTLTAPRYSKHLKRHLK